MQELTDSKTLFNLIVRNASTTETMLMIDFQATGEAYNDDIIYYIILFKVNYNLAVAMTRAAILPKVINEIRDNQIIYKKEQYVKTSNNWTPDKKKTSEREKIHLPCTVDKRLSYQIF